VLALGAHSDYIEIGCGATILALQELRDVDVTWVVFGAGGARGEEARESAEVFLAGSRERRVLCHEFRDGYFPYVGGEIKDVFEGLKAEIDPDVVFTHTRADLHQDHRLVCELTWNTWRDHFVLEYEIPKYDGDLGAPNAYFPVTVDIARRKVDALLDSFPTQRDKHWFDEEVFLGLMRLRGMEGHSASGYAEAFYARKVLLGGGA
jgi:LmbE family N-acetylglucosaminyl deacetylase